MDNKIFKLSYILKYMDLRKCGIMLLFIILLFPLVNASSPIQGPFKINTNSNITQTCTINGTICDYCILTTVSLGSEVVIYNTNLTKRENDFYHQFVPTSLGTYKSSGLCFYGPINRPFNFEFDVTNNGFVQTIAQGISSLSFIIILTIIMILLGYVGWRLVNSETLWALGVFFIGLAFIMLTYNIWLLYEYKINYTGGATSDAAIPQIIFYIFMTVLTAGGMTGIVLLVTKWKEVVRKFKEAIKPEDDKDDLI